jgi:hypothetical protein
MNAPMGWRSSSTNRGAGRAAPSPTRFPVYRIVGVRDDEWILFD